MSSSGIPIDLSSRPTIAGSGRSATRRLLAELNLHWPEWSREAASKILQSLLNQSALGARYEGERGIIGCSDAVDLVPDERAWLPVLIGSKALARQRCRLEAQLVSRRVLKPEMIVRAHAASFAKQLPSPFR